MDSYSILCTVQYTVYRAVYSTPYIILYAIQYCTLCSVQCTIQYTVYCTVYGIQNERRESNHPLFSLSLSPLWKYQPALGIHGPPTCVRSVMPVAANGEAPCGTYFVLPSWDANPFIHYSIICNGNCRVPLARASKTSRAPGIQPRAVVSMLWLQRIRHASVWCPHLSGDSPNFYTTVCLHNCLLT